MANIQHVVSCVHDMRTCYSRVRLDLDQVGVVYWVEPCHDVGFEGGWVWETPQENSLDEESEYKWWKAQAFESKLEAVWGLLLHIERTKR